MRIRGRGETCESAGRRYNPAVMPTYEYACKACGHTFEIVQSMTDDTLTVCPECGGELRKIFAAPAIAFKGSGFYATDHGKNKKRSAAESTGDAADGSKGDPKRGGSKGEDPKGGGAKDDGSKGSSPDPSGSSGGSSSGSSGGSPSPPTTTKPQETNPS